MSLQLFTGKFQGVLRKKSDLFDSFSTENQNTQNKKTERNLEILAELPVFKLNYRYQIGLE